MKRARTTGLLLVLALAAPACGPSQAQIRVQPFPPALARVFDDSVDYVTDVEGLGGRVASEWQSQIDQLSRASDIIAPARIETVVMEQDPDGTRAYRLTAVLTDPIKGELPEGHQVQLRVHEGGPGFHTVAGREQRLQAGRYLVFVRWYTDGAGTVRAHFHLSPQSDALTARVRAASGYLDRTHGQERVVRRDGPQTP